MSQKKAHRGARPIKVKQPPKRIPWNAFPWRSLLVLLLTTGIVYAAYLGQQRWLIQDVLIQGNLRVNTHTEIGQKLLWLKQASFFNVELDKIKQQLMQLPLISDVQVRRVWPASIKVALLEAKPVAILNGTKVLGSDGKLSVLPTTALPKNLTQLAGSERHVDYAIKLYPQLQASIAQHALLIHTLRVSNLGALSVELEQGVDIYLGRKQLPQRLARLNKLLKQINIQQVQSIDLRYNKGAAIHWQAQEDKG